MRIEEFHDENGNARCVHVGNWLDGDEPKLYETMPDNPAYEWVGANDFVNIIFEVQDKPAEPEEPDEG